VDDPNENPQPSHQLGATLFSCRPTPVLEWHRLLSGHPPLVMVAANVFACVVLAIMGMGLVVALFEQLGYPLDRSWVWLVLALMFVTISPLYVWAFFVAPQKDFLILHEKGFRHRLNGRYPSSEYLFSQIRSFKFGEKIDGSWIENTLKIVRPGIGRNLGFRRQSALEVTMKNGAVKRIEFLLVRFDPEDTAKFSAALMERFEQLKAAEIKDWTM
jgi:hypothetical protein